MFCHVESLQGLVLWCPVVSCHAVSHRVVKIPAAALSTSTPLRFTQLTLTPRAFTPLTLTQLTSILIPLRFTRLTLLHSRHSDFRPRVPSSSHGFLFSTAYPRFRLELQMRSCPVLLFVAGIRRSLGCVTAKHGARVYAPRSHPFGESRPPCPKIGVGFSMGGFTWGTS